MPRRSRFLDEPKHEPYERIGLCCGCGYDETKLIRVFPSRYRCERRCARLELAGTRTQWIPGEPRID